MIVVVAFLWTVSTLLLKRMLCSMVLRKEKREEEGRGWDESDNMWQKCLCGMHGHVPRISRLINSY